MKGRYYLLLTMLLQTALLSAQERVTTVGIQYKPIFSRAGLRSGPVFAENDNMELTITPRGGYSFGMVIRRGFTERFSLESGINMVNRNYELQTIALDTALVFDDSFRWISYEIPLQLLVYIQMGERIFLNASGGVSFDFFPSDIEGFNDEFSQRTYRRSWIKPALLANLGAEYRTDFSGYFYLGASFHQPFSDMSVTMVKARGTDRQVHGFLNGSYLTIDLRYFFPQRPDPL